jgi:lipopolysaccharide heptosyltransferase I
MNDRNSPRILIVKLTAIGDIVHAMPVACALRAHFPSAFTGWLAEGRAADILRGHRAIDELIVAPRRWSRSLRSIWALRRKLRRFDFDVTLDLQGLTKSALAAWLCGAKHRIGFAGAMGREISTWLNNDRRVVRSPHVVDRYLELLGALGIERPEVTFDVPRPAAEATQVEQMLAQTSLSHWERGGARDFTVINPGAGWPSKRWPPKRFAAVARHLLERHNLPSLVAWAGPEEHAWAQTIAAESNGAASVAPSTSLLELAELARRARLFIAADTGPLHVAAAVGTPCVGLFGPMPAERNGAYGPGHVAIQKARLQGGSRARRRADNGTMLAITVEDVANACDKLLARPQGQAA